MQAQSAEKLHQIVAVWSGKSLPRLFPKDLKGITVYASHFDFPSGAGRAAALKKDLFYQRSSPV